MKYLIVLKQETEMGRFIIKTSEGAYVSTQKDFVEVNNKEGHVELLIPINSVLFIEAIDSEKEASKEEDDFDKEEEKEECLDKDEELTNEEIEMLMKRKEKIIDDAIKKFFNK